MTFNDLNEYYNIMLFLVRGMIRIFFSSGADFAFSRGRNIFIRGWKAPSVLKNCSAPLTPPKKRCPWGILHKEGGGGRINSYRETSFGVCPLCPQWELFSSGQKHTIMNFIRGIFKGGAYAPPDLVHQGICPLCPTAWHASITCAQQIWDSWIIWHINFALFCAWRSYNMIVVYAGLLLYSIYSVVVNKVDLDSFF